MKATDIVIDFSKGLWSCFVGSCRMILFLICMLYTLLQALWLGVLIRIDFNPNVGGLVGSIGPGVYLHALYFLGVALLGCYASFYRHRKSLKTLTILTGINALIFTLIAAFALNPGTISEVLGDARKELNDYATSYKWENSILSPFLNMDDNRSLQRQEKHRFEYLPQLFCCGIDGPSDWDRNRPSFVSSSRYPSTCCPSDSGRMFTKIPRKSLCDSDSEHIFQTGCIQRLGDVLWGIIAGILFAAGFQFVLCFLSSIVCHLHLDNIARRAGQADAEEARQDQGYQKFSNENL